MRLTLGSLFDGIGGFPLAALHEGIEPIWASEIEPNCVTITEQRFPNMIQLGDITGISGAHVPPVDIITFGSPCTNLSLAGQHNGFDITFECSHDTDSQEEDDDDDSEQYFKKTIKAMDKRLYLYEIECPVCFKRLTATNESALFFNAIRIVEEMRESTYGKYPSYAIWENVPGAFSSGKPKGSDFRAVLEAFTKTCVPMPSSGRWAYAGMVRVRGVDLAWRVLDAQYWGVPQRRRRIFLVADFTGYRASEILVN